MAEKGVPLHTGQLSKSTIPVTSTLLNQPQRDVGPAGECTTGAKLICGHVDCINKECLPTALMLPTENNTLSTSRASSTFPGIHPVRQNMERTGHPDCFVQSV